MNAGIWVVVALSGFLTFSPSFVAQSQQAYQKPPQAILDVLDAAPMQVMKFSDSLTLMSRCPFQQGWAGRPKTP